QTQCTVKRGTGVAEFLVEHEILPLSEIRLDESAAQRLNPCVGRCLRAAQHIERLIEPALVQRVFRGLDSDVRKPAEHGEASPAPAANSRTISPSRRRLT